MNKRTLERYIKRTQSKMEKAQNKMIFSVELADKTSAKDELERLQDKLGGLMTAYRDCSNRK